ncbi:hypothetical protein V8F20_004840 [Naviculisporaceae sp. PSN 640]
MDDQKRSSGGTRGLASPTIKPVAAEAKIPLVIVSQPSQASVVPAEMIGIAVDYDPGTTITNPEARHTSVVTNGPEEANDEPIFRLAESDDEETGAGDGDVTSGRTVLSVVGKNVDESEAKPRDWKWLSATPPAASSSLAPANTKAGTNLLQPPSVRRGPVLRHDRLQHSETMASTRRVMDPMDEEHQAARYKMQIRMGQVAIVYSYIALLLSSIAFFCLATVEVLFLAGTIPVLDGETGIVVGLVLAAISMIVSVGLIIWTTKKHHKVRENPVDNNRNSWIELQHRQNKPLPPRPSSQKNLADEYDPKVQACREKFVEDKDRLFSYLYGLEKIVDHPDFKVCHDILALARSQPTTTDSATDTEGTPTRRHSKLSPSRMFSGATHNDRLDSGREATVTPKASSSGKKIFTKHAHASKNSISNATLLKNDSAGAEVSVPNSTTNEDILSELCDGVTAATSHRPLSSVIAADISTSRRSSRDQSDIASISGGSQKRWSRRGYANLDEVAEPTADPYSSENYRRKGKGRAD